MAKKISLTCFLSLVILFNYTAFAQFQESNRDLSGVWMNDNTLDERLKRAGLTRLDPNTPNASPPSAVGAEILTDEYSLIYDREQQRLSQLAIGTAACGWQGMPRIMTYPYPFEILLTSGRVTIIYETESQVRRVYLDRNEHLPFDELDPSYQGDSIGWWEGDTFVIDTIGLNTITTVGRGLPHSEEMHIVERWQFVDDDTINVEMVISDPLAFIEPLVQEIVYSKRPTWRIREYHCEENNRDAPDEDGQRTGGLVDNIN